MSADILDAINILRSKIPIVPVKTHLWRRESTDSTPHKPITSPTFAAPWLPANQVLPIVRTHRITLSTLPPDACVLEAGIDGGAAFSSMGMAIAVDCSLRRSASDSMQRALIRHLCGLSQQSSVSAVNQSSSSSLVEACFTS